MLTLEGSILDQTASFKEEIPCSATLEYSQKLPHT